MGAESCRWISIQTVALLYPKCALSQTMKSQRSISNNELQPPTQREARVNLIVISKTFFWYSCNLNVFLWQRNGNTANKVWLFLAFKQSAWPFLAFFSTVWLFIQISSGNPVYKWLEIYCSRWRSSSALITEFGTKILKQEFRKQTQYIEDIEAGIP